MISRAQNKYIRSLAVQKYRNEHKVFIAEGIKIVSEWLSSNWPIQWIAATRQWLDAHQPLISQHPEAGIIEVTEKELEEISCQPSPNQVLLVVHLPEATTVPEINDWCLALDTIQDPGNMGTIIRIADWFGIQHIICSEGCVDIWNPKVVQAAMGGHLRVQAHYVPLAETLSGLQVPIYAAALNGESIYSLWKPKPGILLIGNESKGISAQLMALATQKVTIPRQGGAESLNAAVSTGILCALLAGKG